MEYHYTDGVNNFGPFSLEQLKQQPINRNTQIWHTGLPAWKPAYEIPELASWFGAPQMQGPPPVQQTYGQSPVQGQAVPKTWLLESILVTIFCCLPFGIAGIVFASRVESKYYSGDINGAMEASREAGKWTKLGLWIGLAVIILYLIMVFALGIGGIDALDNVGNF
jgi:hypothetical protein